MKKARRITLILIIAAALFAGCQPTPEQGVVMGKDLEQMLALATSPQEQQGTLAEVLGIMSNHYEKYLENHNDNIRVTVDANIVLPGAGSLPIVRVTSQAFSQTTVDKLVEALLGEGQLYDPDSLSELTRSDIVALLVQLNQRKTELEAQGMQPTVTDSITGADSNEAVAMSGTMNQLDGVIASIAFFEDKLDTAPDTRAYVEATATIDENAENSFAKVGRMNPNGGVASLMVINSGDDASPSHQIQFVNRGDYDATRGQYFGEAEFAATATEKDRQEAAALSHPAMSTTDAQAITDTLLDSIGVDDLDCALVEKVIGGSSSQYADGVRVGNMIKAYRLQYVRRVSGVPVTCTNVEYTWNDTDSSEVWSWNYERMTFIVSDSGIVEMTWTEPYAITDVITPTTNILPFAKIQSVFEKMVLINNTGYYRGIDLNITEVRLGLARITEQHNMQRGLLVPVWDFFGTATYDYESGELESYMENVSGRSYLTINAIDGTIIDRNLGY